MVASRWPDVPVERCIAVKHDVLRFTRRILGLAIIDLDRRDHAS
jgi:hypothetical protein